MKKHVVVVIWGGGNPPQACIPYIGEATHVTELVVPCSSDVIAGTAFLFIFIFNAFGYNKEHMYVMDSLTELDCTWSAVWIAGGIALNTLHALVLAHLAKQKLTPGLYIRAWNYGIVVLRKFYWQLVWLMISTSLVSGACMIMKHDGMDFSFAFEDWRS